MLLEGSHRPFPFPASVLYGRFKGWDCLMFITHLGYSQSRFRVDVPDRGGLRRLQEFLACLAFSDKHPASCSAVGIPLLR